MNWTTGYYHLSRYKYTSSNQHGDRFKRNGAKKVNITRLSCETKDAADLVKLVLLSHTLNVPVHYDFADNMAFIEVMSAEAVRGKT